MGWPNIEGAIPRPYLVLHIIFIFICFTTYNKLFSRPSLHPKAPPLTHGVYPIVGALKFFTHRWDFFREAARASPTGNFSFFVGRKPVIGLTAEASRQVFFDNRHFGFAEGYDGLAEGIRLTQKAADKMDFSKFFNSRMVRVLRTDAMQRNLPKLIGDVRARLGDLAVAIPNKGFETEAVVDPFDDIFKIAFQLTIRSVGCGDIADDLELMGKMIHWYHLVDSLTSPTAVIYPWIPTWGMFKRTVAVMRLFEIVKKIGDERLRTGKRGEDAMQIMIDQGDDMGHIVGFVVSGLLAGTINSGVNASWILIFLSLNPYWMTKVRDEVQAAIRTHATTTDPNATIVEKLASVPLEAWESDFPTIEVCLRECIRLTATGATFRRNTSGQDIQVGSEVVPKDAYVAYSFNDIHQNPSVYPNPTKWDPDRYSEGRAEDKKRQYAYLGWGVGKHPCLGIRFAKLEQYLIVALFTTVFDYVACDSKGNPITTPTPIDLNAFSARRPEPRVYLKYKLKEKI
ncbi:cytochrome P450 6A1 [Bimuria novae-zelandiae CBS 107.79]|uniref:Cytochrome P450 6A1 n=1 Tax=Bimuria novae-zelandiae CBS 107.79 TaxID=1447943 RepID=A0A6A5V498_9PLEO|nr:cytochrome P450 6A1 [Bimuria novae-zelandiae CBS 107.79]